MNNFLKYVIFYYCLSYVVIFFYFLKWNFGLIKEKGKTEAYIILQKNFMLWLLTFAFCFVFFPIFMYHEIKDLFEKWIK